MTDIIVIGAGPAGLTAALYALRAEKSVLVMEKESFGGQITDSPKVENYPGIPQMSGSEFADKLLDQVVNHGAQIEMEKAVEIKADGDERIVVTESGSEFRARSVIIAAGSRHRHLGVPGEEELIGSGVSFCAVCDGAFYKDREVAIIGGGNSALQEAILLSETCKKVYVVQNLDRLTGEKRQIAILEQKANVEIILNTVVDSLKGNGELEAVVLKNAVSGDVSELKVDGVFVAIGQQPENEAFASVVDIDERGYIIADETGRTKDPAVFVAGDCRVKTVRQITTAVGDGASAAVYACRYLELL